jgi:hypothetical protein
MKNKNLKLRRLYLNDNEISNKGLKHLGNIIKMIKTIEVLCIRNNVKSRKNDMGVAGLCENLAHAHKLTYLDVSGNRMKKDAIESLMHIITHNDTIRTLNISNLGLYSCQQKMILGALFTKLEQDWGINNNLEHLYWTEGQEQWITRECEIGTCKDKFLERQKDEKDLNSEVAEEFLKKLPSVYFHKFRTITIGGVHPECRDGLQR